MENNKTNLSKSRRTKLIEATTQLTVNTGKINGKVKYLIYSEDEKSKKIEELKSMKINLEETIENIYEIAKCLEIEL